METRYSAAEDFRRARSRVGLQEILARLTGKSTELLSYESVRQQLRASGVVSRSLREIPLDDIVGSVGRYRDFTRNFLPKLDSDQERWANVKVAADQLGGLPPIEVYQIGDAFFVHDGHHRVSVARESGANEVQAYVTEVRSKVPLSSEVKPDELILKAEYVDFLTSTGLDNIRPGADLAVTIAGQYEKFLEHIEVHRYYLGIEQQREIPYYEAVVHWYDTVYSPVVETIREQGILHDFPGRTEADLYLWIAKHRADIEKHLGWEIAYTTAAEDLVDQHVNRFSRIASRIGQRVINIIVPGEPELSSENRIRSSERPFDTFSERLFSEILVPVSGQEVAWSALEQAIFVAQREGGTIRGLYVVPDEHAREDENAGAIRDRFLWRCGEVAVPCQFAVDVGPTARTICERGRWNDLIVLKLDHPPGSSAFSRLGSGFKSLIRRCSRPILAVPGTDIEISSVLLAFDGSPKAREALYIATYLAENWDIVLNVLSITDEGVVTEETLKEAERYIIEHDQEAIYQSAIGSVAETVLAAADDLGSELIIMGGYGVNPIVEVVKDTTVDRILNETHRPVLICQ
jgi:nucleotide-binding universal stress UspA family protein